ncbi:MAG: hypothetical protein ACREB7_10485 [Sphingopyxis sp.]|uniref:hypothetical protein n=1 Tax=Sphingopyxis sp. TaxID=1908224 RepID=UPI003D6D257B
MSDEDEDKQKRRAAFDAEEEEAWRADDEYRQQAEQEEELQKRESAIEDMVGWFGENFEDPQNETPYDSEDGSYQYIWGGPFDATEMLGDQFSSEYEQEWIEAAVEQIQASGTFEWAPTASGDFYDHPENDTGRLDNSPETVRENIAAEIIARLDKLEAQLAELDSAPAAIGHNHPPDEIDPASIGDEIRGELDEAIATTRQEVEQPAPDEIKLTQAESIFRRFGAAIMRWIGRKLDLIVDEAIKTSIQTIGWGAAAGLALTLADDIAGFIRHLF